MRLVPHDYQVGQTLELVVERIAYGGDSIAYAPDGRIVFFRGAAPKDVVQVRLLQVRKRFLRAVVLGVEAGPERVEPFCQFYEKCGGCPWQAVPKKLQGDTPQCPC